MRKTNRRVLKPDEIFVVWSLRPFDFIMGNVWVIFGNISPILEKPMGRCQSLQALEEIPFPDNAAIHVPWSDNILGFILQGLVSLLSRTVRSQRLTRKIHETLVRVPLIFVIRSRIMKDRYRVARVAGGFPAYSFHFFSGLLTRSWRQFADHEFSTVTTS